jgi:hypothetical protein
VEARSHARDNITIKPKLEVCFVIPRHFSPISTVHDKKSTLFRIVSSKILDKGDKLNVKENNEGVKNDDNI